MYNFGLDGDDTLLEAQKQKAESADYSGFYDDEPSPRGEDHSDLVSMLTTHLLRLGLLLQTSALCLMFIFYLGFGGTGIFIFDIYAGPESVKISTAFHLCISLLTIVHLIGAFYIAMFQVFVADNSKWTRGFRMGSKLLSGAVTLDILSMSLRLIQYLYGYYFMSMKWWSRYNQTKAEWSLFTFGNTINSLALLLYGLAYFYLEAYHDEGTFEEYAWLHLGLFSCAAVAELLMVFTGYGAFFTIILLGAMFSATLWSFNFEPLLEKWTPELHSRDVNADILPEATATSGPVPGQDSADNIAQGYGGANAIDNSALVNGGAGKYEPFNYGVGASEMGAYGVAGGMAGYAGDMSTMMNNADIPTSYDYSQFNQQLGGGFEMGVIGGESNH